jgi:metallo-beta-lactamase family protein
MNITFHGAAQTVTGSQHLLQVNGHTLLLECGLFQGRRQETYERNRHFPYDPAKLDAVILSHAHIDHSGNLPHLVKKGYCKDIYATHATAHLSNLMLVDSGHIHEDDAAYLNAKRARRGQPLVEPLYTIEDAARVAQYFRCVDYNEPFEPIPGVVARLVEAGHILGSAAIVLDVEEKGRTYRLWFSGDIGQRHLPILRDPLLPQQAQVLIMECTYGDRAHPSPEESYAQLRQVVLRTAERGGKVIIPAFAVGRTQDLVYAFHQMSNAGDIPRLPIYVDSPLAVNASEIFRAHPECYDQETLDFTRNDPHQSVFDFELLTYIRSVEESKSLNSQPGPMVIISASGMAETGRILHHIKNNIEDPRNTILIVSWQAPETLGRRLAEGQEHVKIFGETYHRRAEVVVLDSFSAHAGQPLLVEYALACRHTLKHLFLVHGEAPAAQALREKLESAGINNILYPEVHQSVEV